MIKKKPSGDLYNLIHSLSPTEKSYFRKYSKQYVSRDTEYLKLFEAINKMKTYDDEYVKQHFRNSGFLKNYLFRLILTVMVGYYNNPRYSRIYLANLYMNSALLEYKGLTGQAIKELKRGMAVAKQKNDNLTSYALSSRMYRLEVGSVPVSERLQYIQKKFIELSTLLQEESRYLRYRFEFEKLIILATQKTQGVPISITENDINLKLIEELSNSSNKHDRRTYEETILAYYMATSAFDKAYPVAKRYVKAEAKLLKNKDNDFYHYSEALTFCVISATELGKYEEANEYLETLYDLKSTNEQINERNLSRYITYKLIVLSSSNDYKRGGEFVHYVMRHYSRYFKSNGKTYHYCPIIAYSLFLLFMNEEYEACHQLLNDVNMVYIKKNALHTYKDLELLRIMLQIKFDHLHLIENLARSASLKLKKISLLDPYTKIVLEFFRILPKGISEKIRLNMLSDLKQYRSLHPQESPKISFMGVFYYDEWIEKNFPT